MAILPAESACAMVAQAPWLANLAGEPWSANLVSKRRDTSDALVHRQFVTQSGGDYRGPSTPQAAKERGCSTQDDTYRQNKGKDKNKDKDKKQGSGQTLECL
jgi:hypothetical protein